MRATPKKKKSKLPTATAPITAKAQQMVDRLRQQHALGREALRSQEEGKSTADFAAEHPYSEHTMRKIKAFARHYSEADLDELCRCRRPNGLPLHWGYIPILLAIQNKHSTAKRKEFQKKAIKKGWTVPELRRAIRDQLGVGGHGRTVNLPESIREGLKTIVESLELLGRRCKKLIDMAKAEADDVTKRKCQRLLRALASARTKAATD